MPTLTNGAPRIGDEDAAARAPAMPVRVVINDRSPGVTLRIDEVAAAVCRRRA